MKRSIGITLRQRRNWMVRLDAAAALGAKACLDGKSVGTNPYRQKSLRVAWRSGWLKGTHQPT